MQLTATAPPPAPPRLPRTRHLLPHRREHCSLIWRVKFFTPRFTPLACPGSKVFPLPPLHSLQHCKPVLFRVEGVVGKCIRREKSEIAEISSEVKSVLMENGYVNQNPGEFEGLVVEKQVLADQQGDVYGADNQDGQQIQVHRNNELLASQETQGPSTPVKINEDNGAGNEVVVREKPILMVTNENRPRLRWTYELHDYFLEAVIKLGGPYSQCSSPSLPHHL
ncbi:hypothetical protein V6N11_077227 [Hibiscus sabdariffa]|uniref:Uncharacterized protein n=1 Tax=Hibiscus sabdariffa TaxID=183260 RepID=A0ABR2TD50_9ROSI